MDRSIETTLKAGTGGYHQTKLFQLVHVSAGWEVAGSGKRETPECWRVVTYDNFSGTRHSRQYNSYEEALDRLRFVCNLPSDGGAA